VELGKGSGFPDLEVAAGCGQVTRLHSLTSASMKKIKNKNLYKKITFNLHDLTLKHPFLQRKNELRYLDNTLKITRNQKHGKHEDKKESCIPVGSQLVIS
jgi:hypothetical protein